MNTNPLPISTELLIAAETEARMFPTEKLGDALSQAHADYQTACQCESSWCPSHKPSGWAGDSPVYCPNPVESDSPRMAYVGAICVSCAPAVAAHDGSGYVTEPYGTWNGE